MIRRPPRSTRTDTLFPYTTLFRSTLEDLSFDEPWLVVDILVEDDSGLPETNVQNCDPARPSTYVRGPGRLRRWEFMVLPGEDPAEIAREENVWRLLSTQLRPDQGRIWRAATYRLDRKSTRLISRP